MPLRLQSDHTPMTDRLNPAFRVEGKLVFAETQSMVAVPLRVLKRPVASLRDHRSAIENAFDFLFHGY